MSEIARDCLNFISITFISMFYLSSIVLLKDTILTLYYLHCFVHRFPAVNYPKIAVLFSHFTLFYCTGKPKNKKTTSDENPLAPLWILLICISVPLLAFSVLVGAKKCSSRLWVPGGFILSNGHDQANLPSTDRSDPVGQEYSLKYVRFILFTLMNYSKCVLSP